MKERLCCCGHYEENQGESDDGRINRLCKVKPDNFFEAEGVEAITTRIIRYSR